MNTIRDFIFTILLLLSVGLNAFQLYFHWMQMSNMRALIEKTSQVQNQTINVEQNYKSLFNILNNRFGDGSVQWKDYSKNPKPFQ